MYLNQILKIYKFKNAVGIAEMRKLHTLAFILA